MSDKYAGTANIVLSFSVGTKMYISMYYNNSLELLNVKNDLYSIKPKVISYKLFRYHSNIDPLSIYSGHRFLSVYTFDFNKNETFNQLMLQTNYDSFCLPIEKFLRHFKICHIYVKVLVLDSHHLFFILVFANSLFQ